MKKPYADLACRVIVGAIFIYAAVFKIFDPCDFAKSINGYKILPAGLINLQAVLLPWTELFCGLLIIQGRFARGASVLITAMFAMFMAAISFNLLRGIDFDCGCFGAEKDICDTITHWFIPAKGQAFNQLRAGCDLVRDAIILIPTIFVVLFDHSRRIVLNPFRKKF